MPIYPVVDRMSGRMYGKGALLTVGLTNNYPVIPTSVSILGGVTKISGPESKRTGKIDLTELAPAPEVGPYPVELNLSLQRTAETYFYALYAGGTKEEGPITISMNMANQSMFTMRQWWRRDVYNFYQIYFRDNSSFNFWAYIEEISTVSGEENKLVTCDIQLQPFPDVQYYSPSIANILPAISPNV